MITLIPHYKRPEVLSITIRQLPEWVVPVYALSNTDPHFEENKAIIENSRCTWFETPNEPLNFKMNALVEYALETFQNESEFMFLNSDTLLNDAYCEFLGIALAGNWNHDVIGTNDLFITKPDFSEAYHFKYPIEYVLGAGRIVKRKVLEKLFPPFPGNQNSGIDGLFYKQCKAHGINHTIIDTSTVPMICDVKTQTNLTPFDVLSNKKEAHEVDWKVIKPYFYGNS